MDKRQLFLGVLVLVLLVVVRLKWDPYPMQEMRLMYFDALQQISPREHQETPVRVVDIDEKSLREIGQWPWPRDIVADMVESLAANGADLVILRVKGVARSILSRPLPAPNQAVQPMTHAVASPAKSPVSIVRVPTAENNQGVPSTG